METIDQDGSQITLYPDAPQWHGKTVAVAKQTFSSVEDGVAVLTTAIEQAKAQGAESIIGPMEGDTWHSYRLPVESDGRPAFTMEPTCGEHDLEVFKKAGFTSIGGYFSADVPLAEVESGMPPARDDLTVSAWDGSDPEGLFTQAHKLCCIAFSDNAFYKPIQLDEFLSMYLPVVPTLDPRLIFQATDAHGVMQGFLFGLPNYAEGQQPASVILKTYASLIKGGGHMLSATFYEAAKQAGYKNAIHALMHDDNLSAMRSASNGAAIFRRYALLGRKIVR